MRCEACGLPLPAYCECDPFVREEHVARQRVFADNLLEHSRRARSQVNETRRGQTIEELECNMHVLARSPGDYKKWKRYNRLRRAGYRTVAEVEDVQLIAAAIAFGAMALDIHEIFGE